MRKPPRYFNLQRPKLRLSWNKHNVYNLARMVGRDKSSVDRMTFFQMKWDAKARTRGYHGEHITEKKWKRMFNHRLLSAVDLPPRYLAENDGSEQSAGRGSGLSTNAISADNYSTTRKFSENVHVTHGSQRPSKKRGDPELMLAKQHSSMTPYMQMAYAPLERRLDMAVFRAMFASSVRQARQFIIHGAVEVNGKKFVHPSYQLNPGDMFQVDVDKVLFATGKQADQRPEHENAKNKSEKSKRSSHLRKVRREETFKAWKAAKESGNEEAVEKRPKNPLDEVQREMESLEANPKFSEGKREVKQVNAILSRISQLKERAGEDRKLDRVGLELAKDIKSRIAQLLGGLPEETRFEDMIEDFRMMLANRDTLLSEVFEDLQISAAETGETAASPVAPAAKTEPVESAAEVSPNQDRRVEKAAAGLTKEQAERLRATLLDDATKLTNEEMRNLARIIREQEENPYDETKPYKTPWEPRPFMSAFAFIPRYLEVNPNICAAVYLRHPVARKGMAEVPTPFSYLTNQLAHNWYLQRGPRMRN